MDNLRILIHITYILLIISWLIMFAYFMDSKVVEIKKIQKENAQILENQKVMSSQLYDIDKELKMWVGE